MLLLYNSAVFLAYRVKYRLRRQERIVMIDRWEREVECHYSYTQWKKAMMANDNDSEVLCWQFVVCFSFKSLSFSKLCRYNFCITVRFAVRSEMPVVLFTPCLSQFGGSYVIGNTVIVYVVSITSCWEGERIFSISAWIYLADSCHFPASMWCTLSVQHNNIINFESFHWRW